LDVRLIYFLYRFVQLAALPFIVLYFLFRGFKDRRYFRQFGQRLGFLPHCYKQTAGGAVWLHAVSVGEVLASMTLLRRLRETFPTTPVFVSCATLAGKALADERLGSLSDGVFYAPVDYCFAIRRVLRTIRPAVVVVAETEIWPNLYREAKRVGCGLLVINGRISDRAFPRYVRLRWFFRRVLVWPQAILAQSEISRQRYLELGAPAARVRLGGNLKYDFDPNEARPSEAVLKFVERLRPEAIWVAASTMPPAFEGDIDEDDAVIEAFGALEKRRPGLLLMLAPRKPERFDAVAGKLQSAGVAFTRRSSLNGGAEDFRLPGVLLVDTIGELSGLFSLADVVFMGGTLAKRGGHNILEPAFFGKPVITGPHMENFAEIAGEFSRAKACLEIPDGRALTGAVAQLLEDRSLREAIGERARGLAESRRGATQAALDEIMHICSTAVPRFRPVLPVFHLLWLLSRVWWLGSAVKRALDRARKERLATPVISVGSISMGGSGKTPFVLWLAEELKKRGHEPAILTRGYRRRAPEERTVLEAGSSAPVTRTGDEAQLFLRSGVGPVGISAHRAATGRLIERQFGPDVFVLDDGFQHWRLERQLDIVLVDGLRPFGGGELFPLGHLRESMAGLRRAGIFVVTRAERGRPVEGIRQALRSYQPNAPVFLSRVVPTAWVDAGSGEEWDAGALPFESVAAFCGLANPFSFWHTLTQLGIRPPLRWEFPDHHHYKPFEIRRMAQQSRSAGIEALLTTEKDLMNLSEQAPEWVEPLRLLWLKIGVQVDREQDLLGLVERQLFGRSGLQSQQRSLDIETA